MSLGGFSFAHADSTLTGYTPATTTTSSVGSDKHGLNIYNQGQSFQVTSDVTITGFDFLSNGVIGESLTGYLWADGPSGLHVVATSSSVGSYTPPLPAVRHYTFTTPYAAVAGNYVVTETFSYNIQNLHYGTRTGNPYVTGCVTNAFLTGDIGVGCSTTYDPDGSDAYFEIYYSPLTTGITAVNSPTDNLSYSTPIINFNFDFYSGTTAVTSAGIQLADLTSALSVDTSAYTLTNSSSGSKNYNKTMTLTTNHRYQWRPYIYTTSGYIFGSYRLFNTGSTTPAVTTGIEPGLPLAVMTEILGGGGQYNAIETIDTLTEGNASTTLEGFVGNVYSLQNVLVTKFPFNYFVEIATTLSDILSSSTTTTAYTFSVNFTGNYATTSGASPFSILPSTWTVIAPSTMDVYYPESTRTFFRSLLLTVIVVAWGLMMFNRVRFLFT